MTMRRLLSLLGDAAGMACIMLMLWAGLFAIHAIAGAPL